MMIFKKFFLLYEAIKKDELLTEVISRLESLGYIVKIKNGRVIAYTHGNRYNALKNILDNFAGSTHLKPDTEQIIRVASIGYIKLNNGLSVVVKPVSKNKKEAEEKASNDLDKLIKEAIEDGENGITIKIGDDEFKNIVEATTKRLKGDPKADITLIDKDGDSVAFISHKKGGGAAAFQQYGGLSEKSGMDVYMNPEVTDFVNNIAEYLKTKNLDNIAQPGMSFLTELPDSENSKKLIGKSIYGKDWSTNGKNFGENFVNCIGQGDPELKKKGDVYELNFSDDMHTHDDLSWAFVGEYKACLGATYRIGRQIKNEKVTIKNLRGGIYPFLMLSGRNFIKL
jgi:hypothetical protein